MAKKAFITGITGQDGSYLAEFLLAKGYEVHGLVKKNPVNGHSRDINGIGHIKPRLKLHLGSLDDLGGLERIFQKVKPDECYHLAAHTFLNESDESRGLIMSTNIAGTLNVLSAAYAKAPKCRLFFAASSQMFGNSRESPQSELTPFIPLSSYAASKVAGFYMVMKYRQDYGMFACSGILFNHESPRRGHDFVTRKISLAVANIKNNKDNVLLLGNLDAKRDWGFAGDYVNAMWLMLQQDNPDDYVIATGEAHSVNEFVELAFRYAEIRYELVDLHLLSKKEADDKVDELRRHKGKAFVVQYPDFYRPNELHLLKGDASKAREKLGWKPTVSFKRLAKMMVKNDLKNYSCN